MPSSAHSADVQLFSPASTAPSSPYPVTPDLEYPTRWPHISSSRASHVSDALHGEDYSHADLSYNIENYTQIKDIHPEWAHDEIDEIVVLSPKPRSATPASPTLSQASANIDSYHLLRVLGQGASATVFLAQDTAARALRAIKVTALAPADTSAAHARVEVAVLRALAAPFLPHLHCSFADAGCIHVVTDFCPGGDLLTHITRDGAFESIRVRFYAAELAEALFALRVAHIVHRDLKPENVLLDAQGHILVTDFGCAKAMASSDGAWPLGSCGTAEYQSPEAALGWAHDYAVDVWGFGLLLYLMLYGKHPFMTTTSVEGRKLLKERIVTHPLQFPQVGDGGEVEVDEVARDLVVKCLERNAALRLDILQIRQHPYFEGIDWDRVASKGYEVPWTPELESGQVDLRYFEKEFCELDVAQEIAHLRRGPANGEVLAGLECESPTWSGSGSPLVGSQAEFGAYSRERSLSPLEDIAGSCSPVEDIEGSCSPAELSLSSRFACEGSQTMSLCSLARFSRGLRASSPARESTPHQADVRSIPDFDSQQGACAFRISGCGIAIAELEDEGAPSSASSYTTSSAPTSEDGEPYHPRTARTSLLDVAPDSVLLTPAPSLDFNALMDAQAQTPTRPAGTVWTSTGYRARTPARPLSTLDLGGPLLLPAISVSDLAFSLSQPSVAAAEETEADLPPGVERIGAGIGFTPKKRGRAWAFGRLAQTPRRLLGRLSLGTSVAGAEIKARRREAQVHWNIDEAALAANAMRWGGGEDPGVGATPVPSMTPRMLTPGPYRRPSWFSPVLVSPARNGADDLMSSVRLVSRPSFRRGLP